jgi:hypothetical protein
VHELNTRHEIFKTLTADNIDAVVSMKFQCCNAIVCKVQLCAGVECPIFFMSKDVSPIVDGDLVG